MIRFLRALVIFHAVVIATYVMIWIDLRHFFFLFAGYPIQNLPRDQAIYFFGSILVPQLAAMMCVGCYFVKCEARLLLRASSVLSRAGAAFVIVWFCCGFLFDSQRETRICSNCKSSKDVKTGSPSGYHRKMNECVKCCDIWDIWKPPLMPLCDVPGF